jgi:CheY-like chemotaxis protein
MNSKILLVDDDADDRLLFCEAWQETAPEVVLYTSANGRKALTALDNKEIKIPDLIFLDINMPLMNGWQFLAIIKERDAFKHIPVIMYSTSSHGEDVEKACQFGALCFFVKPVGFKDLKKCLAIVAEHLRKNTMPALIGSSSFFRVPETHA